MESQRWCSMDEILRLFLPSRAAGRWGTGWCCRGPWTWRRRRRWWGRPGLLCGEQGGGAYERLRTHFSASLKSKALWVFFLIKIWCARSWSGFYLMRLGTQEMFGVEDVKGEATEDSISDREIPLWALFKAWSRHSQDSWWITVVKSSKVFK